MPWLLMTGAIAFEVAGTISLKLSAGFTKPVFIGVTVLGYLISFAFLGLALKTLPVSVAYAVWAGAGTALVAAVGMLFFDEPATALKLVCIALIVAGVVGLHLAEKPV